jgi:hypothetical protein
LQTAVELYYAYQLKIRQCEAQIEEQLQHFEAQLAFEQLLAQSRASEARSAQGPR